MTDAIDIRARLAGAPPSTWVDLRDAAAYLGWRPSSLRSAIARGQIAPDGRGPRRSPVFHRSTLDAYLTARAYRAAYAAAAMMLCDEAAKRKAGGA